MPAKQLTVELLGGVRLCVDGKPIAGLPSRKAEALLIYLICNRRPFAREFLADLFWDDRPLDQALANLRSILSSLSRDFKPYLSITRQTIAFNQESNYWLDVADFERASGQEGGRSPTAEPDGAVEARRIALYRGDFLEGFYLRDSVGFEEWALLERERLRRSAVDLLWQLIEQAQRQGDYPRGLEYVDQLLRADNLSERAHGQKMRFLAHTGQYNLALNQFEICRQILDEELGVAPAPEIVDLYRRIQTARSTPRPQLPPPLPHFLGREREQQQLLALLRAPDARLITLLGAGGMGKTRLAIETLRTLVTQEPGLFLDGIYVVPLAGLNNPQLFPSFLAQILGIQVGDREPADLLIESLRCKEMLLLLDNFEPLIEQAGWLGTWLAAAPQLKLLVTSQESLRLQEEWVIELAGLDTPEKDVDSPDVAHTFSALRLFLQIAQRLHPHYRPGAADLAAISRICRLVQGMPLGIELAAVWIRQFSPGQMAEEIEQGLDFLSTNLRNVPERHRSLRAAFSYSWRLLPAQVQGVFARLAPFQGGFSQEAAATVAGATAADLALLVEKSLLRMAGDRYDIHPMLSRFAAEQLGLNGQEEQAARQAHATFYFDFLAGQGSGEAPAQRQAIQTDLLNLRAAWYWASEVQALDRLHGAASTLHSFYSVQSWFRAGIDDFRHALERLPRPAGADGQLDPALAQVRFDLLGRKARMHLQIGQFEPANADLVEAQTYMPTIEDPARRSAVLGYMAMISYHNGEVASAIELTEQSLALDEAAGDQDGIAFGLNYLGSCHKTLGNYALAADYFQRAAAIYGQQNDVLGQAMTLNNLGNLAQAQGALDTAHDYYLMCGRLFQAENHTHGAATTLTNAGRLARKLGKLDEAMSLLQEGLDLKREIEDSRGAAIALIGLGDVALAAGDLAASEGYLTEALTLAHQTGDVKLIVEGLAAWAALLLAQAGKESEGARLMAFVLAHPSLSQEVREQMQAPQHAIPAHIWQRAQAWAAGQTVATATALVLTPV